MLNHFYELLCQLEVMWKKDCKHLRESGVRIFTFQNEVKAPSNLIQGKAQLALKNWKNLFGDQKEDSFTSLEVCYLLK